MSRDFVLLFADSSLVRFRELARSCAVAGLLGEFLLVDENQNAELFLGRVNKPVPYLDYLATKFGGYGSVNAVTIAIGAAADENLRRRRSAFVRDLKQRCADKDIAFRDGTISVPLVDGELSPSFIEPSWAFNLVGVPEDWTGEPRQIGIPLRENSAEDIAFNIAATVTGLWVWTDVPPLAHGVLREHVEQPPLRLIRATTRVVPLGDVVDTIAYAAMDPMNNWPTPNGCEKHPQRELFVKSTLKALIDSKSAALTLREEPKVERPVRERVGILDSIVLYFSHLVANLIGQPAKAWLRTKEKAIRWAEDYVTRKTFQDESRLVVRYGGRLRDEDFVDEGSSRAEGIVESSAIEVPAVLATPERWRVIARAVLGAVDGHPNDIDETIYAPPKFRGSIAVAEERSIIGPNPFEESGSDFSSSLTVNGSLKNVSIRSYDAIRFREIFGEMSRVDSPSGDSAGQQEIGVQIAESERSVTKASLDEWHRHRSSSLLWSIGVHLDEEIQRATSKLQESIDVLASIPARIAEADALQKRKVKRGKWLARLLIVLLIVAVLFPFFAPVAAAGIFAGGVLAIALFFIPYIALLGVLTAWLANARTQVREEFKLEQLESHETVARKRRHHYWGEIHRLEYCYAHFLDWAEILATVVWKPFGQISAPSHPTTITPDVKALSFQFASPVFDSGALLSEQIGMRAKVAGRGWLNEIFAQLAETSLSAYTRLTSTEGTDADPAFDISLAREFVQVAGTRVYKPRFQFLEDLRSGKPQQVVAEATIVNLRESVASRDLTNLVGHVEAHAFVEIDGTQEERVVDEFLNPILEIEELPVFERFVERGGSSDQMKVRTVYWSASGVNPVVALEEEKYTLLGASVSSARAGALATSRVDISAERFWPNELTFIQRPESVETVELDAEVEVRPTSENRTRKRID